MGLIAYVELEFALRPIVDPTELSNAGILISPSCDSDFTANFSFRQFFFEPDLGQTFLFSTSRNR